MKKARIKIIVDIFMVVTLLILMAYKLIGENIHEWCGVGMFFMFMIHHILNGAWHKTLLKGRYSSVRLLYVIVNIALLLIMLLLMWSGIVMSQHVFVFLPYSGIQPVARKVHLVVSYLGFVLMAVHIGLHGNMIMGMAGKIFHRPFKIWKWGKVLLSFMIAGYGVHAVIKREISSYILLKNQFVFFDFKEPIVFFYLDYIAIMGLFILIGNFICSIMRIIDQKSHAKSL